jgi:V/A-type H+-transporting ATPase subunit F
MEMFVIGDEDTVLGFRYAGVQGRAVERADEALEVLEDLVRREARLIVILSEPIAASIRERVNEIRFEQAYPILVEVPGPDGPSPDRPALGRIIQQAVGIRVGGDEGAGQPEGDSS